MESVKEEHQESSDEDEEDEEQDDDIDPKETGENSDEEEMVELDMANLALSEGEEEEIRDLSRSPPKSMREFVPITDADRRTKIKDIVSNDASKLKAQQQRKFHSKRSVRNAGRPQGSKAKQDSTVKLSDHIGWT